MNPNTPFVPKLKKITKFDVAFDPKGNLLDYFYTSWGAANAIREPNAVFTDTLEYVKYYRMGSGVRFQFISKTSGRTFHMFLSDFDEMLKAGKLVNQLVYGTFCFTKRGNMQGLRYHFI